MYQKLATMAARHHVVVLLACLALAAARGLSDEPIVAAGRVALSGAWQLSAPTLPAIVGQVSLLSVLWFESKANRRMPQVPGDLITDLHAASLIPKPYYELNWQNHSLWTANDWTYSKTITFTQGDLDYCTVRSRAGGHTCPPHP